MDALDCAIRLEDCTGLDLVDSSMESYVDTKAFIDGILSRISVDRFRSNRSMESHIEVFKLVIGYYGRSLSFSEVYDCCNMKSYDAVRVAFCKVYCMVKAHIKRTRFIDNRLADSNYKKVSVTFPEDVKHIKRLSNLVIEKRNTMYTH